jgi:cysteinyl-tRNA synthetase
MRMQLHIHDSMTKHKVAFTPADPNRVTLYVCGPTVYNYIHIGNGRPAVVFDVLYRVLCSLYPNVVYARNITDIDDKINNAAKESGQSITEIANRYTDAYNEDVSQLGVLAPSVQPRATDHIAEMISIIEQLNERGHAYAAEGHVLFNVPSDPNYGCLSRRTLEDMLDGARVEVAPYKKDAKDFVLWKPSTPDLPGWDSPWGFGRPGWHIECTAMIHRHLGTTIDIHGGGSDLQFPHHENEIAQGTCVADDEAFVRFWMHNGMINFGSEKMSKSLGNIVTIRDLLATHSGECLRYALLSGHYRSTLTWNDDLIAQSQASLDRFYRAIANVPSLAEKTANDYTDLPLEAFPSSVTSALLDDLNSPEAMAAMHQLAGEVHRAKNEEDAIRSGEQLLAAGYLMGLMSQTTAEYFRGGDVDEGRIEAMIAERNVARGNRDFATADRIRDELTAMGIELEDTSEGTRWSINR